jgi:hypothetical protein
VKSLVGALLVASNLLVGCSGRPSQAIPFELKPDVEQTLVDWREAGITCAEPEVGMPGPAADWLCEATPGDVPVTIRLIVDGFGVQSIHIGVPSTIDRTLAARAFIDVVERTSAIGAARAEIADWLRATEAADGSMPIPSPANVGRVHVDSTDPRQITLYVIPINSSIMSASSAVTGSA